MQKSGPFAPAIARLRKSNVALVDECRCIEYRIAAHA